MINSTLIFCSSKDTLRNEDKSSDKRLVYNIKHTWGTPTYQWENDKQPYRKRDKKKKHK